MSEFEKEIESMRGPYSAIFTPMLPNGEINFEMLTRIADFQLQHGIQGFFVTGSTGEGLLLDFDERVEVIRQLAAHVKGRATTIAHVGHPSTNTAVRLAQKAAQSDVEWIASVAPIYHGTTYEGAMRHYRSIASATERPFMIYSFDANVQAERDAKFFELPNVSGMKYTAANFFSVQQLAERVGRPLALMSGFDEQFVAALSFGFAGGIGSTFNFAPQFYADIFRQYHLGNIEAAAQLQAEVNRVTNLMVQYENWTYRKAIMRYIGFDCGSYRTPYAPITETEYQEYARRLDDLGILARADSADSTID